jgi:hypothetical protein
LTPEEIEDLLIDPDPQTPSHHQVDPRIIKAYLMGESVPTYLPREVPSHYYTEFLPAYLPRDQFEPSERVVPLVNDQYRWDYHTWKNCLDTNTRATKSLVEHLTDPLYQVIEASLSLPEPIFFHTVRAAELRWWNRYLNTYHSFNDLILFRGHYRYSYFNRRHIKTVSWHVGKSAQDIYATALTILQVGQLTIRLPPNPDFNSLSPEEKDHIYQDLHWIIDSLDLRQISVAHRAISCGNTLGSDRDLGLSDLQFVIAFVCRFQVILSHGFDNFPAINDLRQILLDRYERISFEPGYQPTLRPDHQYRTVKEGSSWEGGGPIQLPYIPPDSTITDNYARYQNSAGIETDITEVVGSIRMTDFPIKMTLNKRDIKSIFFSWIQIRMD